MKRYVKYIVIFISIIILWGLYKIFTPNLIDLKEQYLIKRNYSRNVEVFKNSILDFKSYQNMSIEFSEDNYMDAFVSEFQHLITDPIEITRLYKIGEIGQLKLNDSIALFDYKNEQYELKSFKVINSQIEIELVIDSTIIIDYYWSLSYEGYCKSEFFSEIMNVLRLNKDLLEELKNQLRQRNCFGFSNDSNRLILHFRTPTKKLLVCSYSYCIIKNKVYKDEFFDGIYNYGKLDQNIYWFFNDAIQNISLFPGGYENRNI
jgi:hypothetical protein